MNVRRAAIDELCARGAYAEALAALEPEDPSRGEVLYWASDPGARAVLQAARPPEARVAEARWCWQADLYEEALELLAGAPDGPEARATRGLVLLCQGKRDEGAALAAEATRALTGHRRLRLVTDLAVTYAFLGDGARAADLYREAITGWLAIGARHPEAARCLFGLAGTLEKLDPKAPALAEAIEHFLSITPREDGRRAPMVEELASHWLATGDLARAKPLLAELAREAPRPNVHRLQAQVLYLLDEHGPALEAAERAVAAFRQAGDAPALARCLWLTGRLRALRRRPDWEAAFREALTLAEPDSDLHERIPKDIAAARAAGAP